MTYQQKHDELLKKVSGAWNKLLDVDKKLMDLAMLIRYLNMTGLIRTGSMLRITIMDLFLG